MQRGLVLGAFCALSLVAAAAGAQGFGPDTATPTVPADGATPTVPADSGGSIVIAPQNNGTTTYRPANRADSVSAGPSSSVTVSNAAPDGPGSHGTNAVLPDDS